ncbi:conjugal transfer protein TraG N-terminal domain-containing protein [Vibrio sp. 1180_3]|uniref:conjugal transfer protein TraG N-terminal domain-containing protein n=1 Tax=Vibrio sp. 1180_3 TaxID=2528832 RepID=UPI00240639F5|nr:conjugal transfer protein TraG N-terminal domain-containing protein [Vibrio sp. 1180_3]MDF9399158.1 hypothetical protein [Vibrio sp. 1180_3]
MNLVTNDVSGLFLLPLGAVISDSAWDIFNGLGLIFFPFIIIFVMAFMEARAQGLDEGSPAVLAVKSVEKAFWPMLITIVLVVMPVNNRLDMSYRQYSCMTNPSLTSNNLTDIEQSSETVLKALGFNGASPSIMTGLVHTVSTGVNSALIAGMACTQGASKKEVSQFVDSQAPQSESVYRSIVAFENQCHSLAVSDAREALAQQKTIRVSSDNLNGWSFYPPPFDSEASLMLTAYDGMLIPGEGKAPITITIPNTWFEQSKVGQTMNCSLAGKDLYKKIEDDVLAQDNFTEHAEKMLSYVKLFNGKATASHVKHDLIMVVYNDALKNGSNKWDTPSKSSGDNSIFGFSIPTIAPTNIGIINNFISEITTGNNRSIEETNTSVTQSITNAMVTIGAIYSNLVESGKAHAVALIGPLLVVMVQTILIGALPILTVLSGYSGKFLYNWVLLYFSISLTPFWLNLATHLETILLSLSDYSESIVTHASNIKSGTDMQMYLIATTSAMFVYIIPIIWIMLVQMVGNIAGSSFMTLIAGAAVVGQTGGEALASLGQKGAEAGIRGSSGNGSNDNDDIGINTPNSYGHQTNTIGHNH